MKFLPANQWQHAPRAVGVRRMLAFAGVCAALALGACQSSSSYTAPPTTVRSSSIMQARATATAVLIVGDFENPARTSLSWRDIGPGMSQALSRALLNRGQYDVIIKPTLSRDLQKLVGQTAPERDPTLEKVRQEHPEVDYVVIGAVTDFQHTTDLPDEIAPRTWTGSVKREAIVAIDLIVVDLRNERLVSAEHVTGEAPAGKTPTRTLYRDVAFGSYVFWNSPLGKASSNAINRAVARIDALVPALAAPETYASRGIGQARVAQLTSSRGVSITGGRNCGLLPNQVYALQPANASNDDAQLLRDRDTGRLLLVKIHDASEGEASGWLLGKCADPLQLVSARLRPVPSGTNDAATAAIRRTNTPLPEPVADDAPPSSASDASAVTQAGGRDNPN